MRDRNEVLLFEGRIFLQMSAHRLADHRVLAHQDLCLSAHRDPDLLHLLRADIIHADHEQLRVVFQKLLQPSPELLAQFN